MDLYPLGDSAVVARLGDQIDEATLGEVQRLAAAISATRAPGIVDVVPAYTTVTVVYDPARFAGAGARPYQTVCQLVSWCAARLAVDPGPGRLPEAAPVEIPVCYGGEEGSDLTAVADQCRLSPAEVIALHSGATYRVHAIGFVPGFPYLGGLPAVLGLPRRVTPRTRVPAGSVGIGGGQTGVYPLATPGGWHLIGRTPLALFRPREARPCLLAVGDRVRFKAISAEELAAWR